MNTGACKDIMWIHAKLVLFNRMLNEYLPYQMLYFKILLKILITWLKQYAGQYYPTNITFDIAWWWRPYIFSIYSKHTFQIMKGIKYSWSFPKWLLNLGIGKSNVRALRAWALLLPSLGSINIMVRALFLLNLIMFLMNIYALI